MDHQKKIKLSKLLSLVLRHKPSLLSISLDSEGFSNISIDELAARIRKLRGYSWVTSEDIFRVVETDEKSRFEIRDGRIRATYGHSICVRPKYEEVKEAPRLFHGTTREAWERIKKNGLVPMGRRFVHLTTKPEIALDVAKRHGNNPILLEIDGNSMIGDGLSLWKATDIIYLTERVPPRYLKVLRLNALDCRQDCSKTNIKDSQQIS